MTDYTVTNMNHTMSYQMATVTQHWITNYNVTNQNILLKKVKKVKAEYSSS